MAELGADPAHGCGRALWEFNRTPLASYGTTMSLMLLPYWTIGFRAVSVPTNWLQPLKNTVLALWLANGASLVTD